MQESLPEAPQSRKFMTCNSGLYVVTIIVRYDNNVARFVCLLGYNTVV